MKPAMPGNHFLPRKEGESLTNAQKLDFVLETEVNHLHRKAKVGTPLDDEEITKLKVLLAEVAKRDLDGSQRASGVSSIELLKTALATMPKAEIVNALRGMEKNARR